MASETTTSTFQGAQHGAAAGIKSGSAWGPYGAIIGGVIGAVVGGVGGFMSGKKKRKAKKYARIANEIQRQREEEAYRQSFLSEIRKARIERASMLATSVAAGAEEGSSSQGALASYGSQVANTVEYMSVDRGRAILAAQLSARAGKNLSTAQAIDTTVEGAHEVAVAVGNAYGRMRGRSEQDTGTSGVQQMKQQQDYSQQRSVTIGEGMPYLQNNQVYYVPKGQTKTMSY